MKIYNEVILSWNEDKQQFDTVYEDSYDYSGQIDFMSEHGPPTGDNIEHPEECFVAGTKVLMSDNSNKNIEDVEVGEYVKSFNVKTNQFENKLVTKLFTQTHNLKDGDITVKITFDNGVVTHNTIANPFWSEEKGFVAVDEERCNRVHRWVINSNDGNDVQSLDVGDTLHLHDDSDGTLKQVTVENIEYILERDIRTYDITVEDNHTFFANGILTHNSSGTGLGDGYISPNWEESGLPCGPPYGNWPQCINCSSPVYDCDYFSNWGMAHAAEEGCLYCGCNYNTTTNECVDPSAEILGCMDSNACNYDENANTPAEIEYPAGSGEMVSACIYANYQDGSGGPVCTPPTLFGNDPNREFCDCVGNCTAETDCLGVCGGIAVNTYTGCSSSTGNQNGSYCCDVYAGNVVDECNVCNGPGIQYQCCEIIDEFGALNLDNCTPNCCPPPEREWSYDSDGDNHYDSRKIDGTEAAAVFTLPACNGNDINFVPEGFPQCYHDNINNCWNYAEFDSGPEQYGCTDYQACNYHVGHSEEDGSCLYAEPYRDCNGNCYNDTDGDGWCDEEEVDMGSDPYDPYSPELEGGTWDVFEDVLTAITIIDTMPDDMGSPTLYITSLPTNGDIIYDSAEYPVSSSDQTIPVGVEIIKHNPCIDVDGLWGGVGSGDVSPFGCKYTDVNGQDIVYPGDEFGNFRGTTWAGNEVDVYTGYYACQTLQTPDSGTIPFLGIEVRDPEYKSGSHGDDKHIRWTQQCWGSDGCECKADAAHTCLYSDTLESLGDPTGGWCYDSDQFAVTAFWTHCDQWHTPGYKWGRNPDDPWGTPSPGFLESRFVPQSGCSGCDDNFCVEEGEEPAWYCGNCCDPSLGPTADDACDDGDGATIDDCDIPPGVLYACGPCYDIGTSGYCGGPDWVQCWWTGWSMGNNDGGDGVHAHFDGGEGYWDSVAGPNKTTCAFEKYCHGYSSNNIPSNSLNGDQNFNWYTGQMGSSNNYLSSKDFQQFDSVRAICDAPTEYILEGSNTTIHYQPYLDFNGADYFTYKVCDNDIYDGSNSDVACTEEYSFFIEVLPVNDPPVAYDFTVEVFEDSGNNIIWLKDHVYDVDNDVDSDLTFSIIGSGTPAENYGSLTNNNNGSVTFIPDPEYTGITSFQYKANDGFLDSVRGYDGTSPEYDAIIPLPDGTLDIPSQSPSTVSIAVLPMTDLYSIDIVGQEITEDMDRVFPLSCYVEGNMVYYPPTGEYFTLAQAMNGSYNFSLTANFLNGPTLGTISDNGWDGASLNALYSPSLNAIGPDSVDYNCTLTWGGSNWTSNTSNIGLEIFEVADGPIVLPFQLNKYNDVNFGKPLVEDLVHGDYYLDPINYGSIVNTLPLINDGNRHPIQIVTGWSGLEVNGAPEGWYWVDIGPFSYTQNLAMIPPNVWWATGQHYVDAHMVGMGLLGNDLNSLLVLGALQNYHTDCSVDDTVTTVTSACTDMLSWDPVLDGVCQCFCSNGSLTFGQTGHSCDDYDPNGDGEYYSENCYCNWNYDSTQCPSICDTQCASFSPGAETIDVDATSYTCDHDGWATWECNCECSNGEILNNVAEGCPPDDDEWCHNICDNQCNQFSYVENEPFDPNSQYYNVELPLDITKAPFFDPVHSNSKLILLEDAERGIYSQGSNIGGEAYLTVRSFNPSHTDVGTDYTTSLDTLDVQVSVTGGLNPQDVFVTLEDAHENHLVDGNDIAVHLGQLPYYCGVVPDDPLGLPVFGSLDGEGTVGLFNQMCDYGDTRQTSLGLPYYDLPLYEGSQWSQLHTALGDLIGISESVTSHFMDFCWNNELQVYEGTPSPQHVIAEFIYKVSFSPGYYNKSVYYGQDNYTSIDLPVTVTFDFTNNDSCTGLCKSSVSFQITVIETNDPVKLDIPPTPKRFASTGIIPEWVNENPINQGGSIEYSNHTYSDSHIKPWMNYSDASIPIKFKDPNDSGYKPIPELYVPSNVAEPFHIPNSDYSSDYIIHSFTLSDEDAENVFTSPYSCVDGVEDDEPCIEIMQNVFSETAPYPNTLPFIWNLQLANTEQTSVDPPNIVNSDLHTWNDLEMSGADYTRENYNSFFDFTDSTAVWNYPHPDPLNPIWSEYFDYNFISVDINDSGDSWDAIRFRDINPPGSPGANIGNIQGDQEYIIECKILNWKIFGSPAGVYGVTDRRARIRTTTEDVNGSLGDPTHPTQNEFTITNELTTEGWELYNSNPGNVDVLNKDHVVPQIINVNTNGLDLSNLYTHLSLLLGNPGDGSDDEFDNTLVQIYELSIKKVANPFIGNNYNFNLFLFPHKYLHGQPDIHRSITINAYDGRGVDYVPSYCNDPQFSLCTDDNDCTGYYQCITSNFSSKTFMLPHTEKEYGHQYQEGCMHPLSHYSTLPNISGTHTVPTDTCGSNLDTSIDGQWLAENFIVALDESGDTPSQTTPGDFNADKTTTWVTSIDSTYAGRGYPSLISGDDTEFGWEHIIGGNTNITTHPTVANDVTVDNLTPEISYFIDGSDVDGGRVNRSLGVYLPTMHEQLSNPGNFAGQVADYDYYRQYPGFYDMDIMVDTKLYIRGNCSDLDEGIIAERITLTVNKYDNLIEFDGDDNPYNNQTNQDAIPGSSSADLGHFWYDFFQTGNLYTRYSDCERNCSHTAVDKNCQEVIVHSFINDFPGITSDIQTYGFYYFELLVDLFEYYLIPEDEGVRALSSPSFPNTCQDYLVGKYNIAAHNAISICRELAIVGNPIMVSHAWAMTDDWIGYGTNMFSSWHRALRVAGLCEDGEWACGSPATWVDDDLNIISDQMCCDSNGQPWTWHSNPPYRSDIPTSSPPISQPIAADCYFVYSECFCSNGHYCMWPVQAAGQCGNTSAAWDDCYGWCADYPEYTTELTVGVNGSLIETHPSNLDGPGSPQKQWACLDHTGLKLDNEFPPSYVEDGQQDLFKFRIPYKIFNSNPTNLAINFRNFGNCNGSLFECMGRSDDCDKKVYIEKIGFSLPGVVDDEVFIYPTTPDGDDGVTKSYRNTPLAHQNYVGCMSDDWVQDGFPVRPSTAIQFFNQEICEEYGFEWIEDNGANNFTEDMTMHPSDLAYDDGLTVSSEMANGTILFEIPRTFWYDNGFKFADYEQKVKVTNQPEYAQITKDGNEFNENTIPGWYDSGRNYTWETDGVNLRQYYYRLNNIIGSGDSDDDTDGQYVGAGDEIKSIWDNLCNPFNDILVDSFTMHLDIEPNYFGTDYTTQDTPIGTNGTLDRTFNIYLVNDNDFYACNNFNIVGEEAIEPIIVKENFADVDVNFGLLTQHQCGDNGINCIPEIIYEKLINYNTVTTTPTIFEESFEWNYSEPGNCFIQITLDDIDLSHGDSSSSTEILFSDNNGSTFISLGYVGKWWTSDEDFENTIIGPNGGGLTSTYTTGFSGGYNNDGDLMFLQVPTCQPGTNIIKVETNGIDDIALKHVKVTKNDNICSDGSLCGMELVTEPDQFTATKYYWELMFDLFAHLDFGSTSDAEATIEECLDYFTDKYGMAIPVAAVFCGNMDSYNQSGPGEGTQNQGITMGTGTSINSNWEWALYNAGLCTSTTCCDEVAGTCGCCDENGVWYTVDNPPSIVDAIPYNSINSHTFNWQDINPPSNIGDIYQTIGFGYIKDNSVNYLAYSGNLSTCIAMGHCYVEGRNPGGSYKDETLQYHLTEQGLKTYDYQMAFDFTSENTVGVGGKGESFGQTDTTDAMFPIEIAGNTEELQDLINRYNQNKNRYFRVVGYRKPSWDLENQCCTQDEINDGTCDNTDFNLRTLFKVISYGTCPSDSSMCVVGSDSDYYPEYTCSGNETCSGFSAMKYEVLSSDDTGLDEDQTVVQIRGEIYNTPYRFCLGDRLLIDADAGLGSDIYGTLQFDTYDYTPPVLPHDAMNYSIIPVSYTGYEDLSSQTTITPLNLYEGGASPTLAVEVKRTFGQEVISSDGEIALTSDEIMSQDLLLQIEIIGMNPPHINFVKYIDESDRQIGIQDTYLKIYDNIGNDLISRAYLNKEDNRDPDFGVKSTGTINFSVYQPKLDSNNNPIQIPNSKIYLNGEEISLPFNGHPEINPELNITSYIWDNVIKSINNHSSEYIAYLSEDSASSPSSNIKTIIIESAKVGKEFNGVLTWSITNVAVKTQPILTDLVNGEAYPIINVYEDWGGGDWITQPYFDLLIAGSDKDKFANLNVFYGTTAVEGFDEPLIETEVISTSEYQTLTGIPNSSNFAWGNLYPDYQNNYYYYPFGSFIDYNQIPDLNYYFGNATIQYPTADGFDSLTTSHYDLSHINSIVRFKLTEEGRNYNGNIDLNLRVIDEDGTQDRLYIRLRIHPSNDPPVVEAVSDKEMYLNNENYPNDINIQVVTSDIEEHKESLSLISIDTVDSNYCKKIESAGTFIEQFDAPIQSRGMIVIPHINLVKSQIFDEYSSQQLTSNSILMDAWKNQFGPYTVPSSTVEYGIDDPSGNNEAVRVQFGNPGMQGIPIESAIDMSLEEFFNPDNFDTFPGQISIRCDSDWGGSSVGGPGIPTYMNSECGTGFYTEDYHWCGIEESPYCQSAIAFTGISQGPGFWGQGGISSITVENIPNRFTHPAIPNWEWNWAADGPAIGNWYHSTYVDAFTPIYGAWQGNPTIPNYFLLEGEVEPTIEHPKSILRYYFHPDTNDLIPGKKYYYSGCVRSIQPGVFWDGWIDDGSGYDAGDVYNNTLSFDVGDDNTIRIPDDNTPIGEWYCFFEEFTLSDSFPIIDGDGQPKIWLDVTPGNEHLTGAIVDLYNIRMVTFDNATGDIEPVNCAEMAYCLSICYESFGMGPKQSEELCGFANYISEGDLISILDVSACEQDIDQYASEWIPKDTSLVGGRNSQCNLKKTFIDLIYDMYFYYSAQAYTDGTCTNQGATGTCDDGSSCVIGSTTGFFDDLDCDSGECTANADIYDITSDCLTLYACENYLENIVGITDIPSQFEISDPDIDDTYLYFDFINPYDSASDICSKMDTEGNGVINRTSIDKLLESTSESIDRELHLNESITVCSSGPSYGKLCEMIDSHIPGDCNDGVLPCSVNNEGESTCSDNEVCRDGYCHTECNYNVDDGLCGEYNCIPVVPTYPEFKYGEPNNGLCDSFSIPNFLSFDSYGTQYNQFLENTGYDYLNTYVHIEPEYNSVGSKKMRIAVRDTGFNENDDFTQIRTGYSTFNVNVSEGSIDGPTGTLASIPVASFGITPDTYKYQIGGTDVREQIPTTIEREHNINVYGYHELTIAASCSDGIQAEQEECEFLGFEWIPSNRILSDCGALGPLTPEDPGLENDYGECCSTIPASSSQVNNYYNSSKGHYYEQEWRDELELYSRYYSGFNSRFCNSDYTVNLDYSNYFTNDNIEGFEPPNSFINPLDYTKSYKFKIIDVVENYDEIGYQDDASIDWWNSLGFEYTPQEWQEIWNNLRREGWVDLFGPRVEGHPITDNYCLGYCQGYDQSSAANYNCKQYFFGPDDCRCWCTNGYYIKSDDPPFPGDCDHNSDCLAPCNEWCSQFPNPPGYSQQCTDDNDCPGQATCSNLIYESHPSYEGETYDPLVDDPVVDCVVFEGEKLTQGEDTVNAFQQLIGEGYVYRFEYPSIYKITVESEDTYSSDDYPIIGESSIYLDARDILLLEQTIRFKFDPWQGINVIPDIHPVNDNALPIRNDRWFIDSKDKDQRPSLGVWFYNDLLGNKTTNWFIRHGYDYQDVEGNFIGSYNMDDDDITEDMEFVPDAYVFTPTTIGDSNAVLTKYYDNELQETSYKQTSAPLEARIFFYTRDIRNVDGTHSSNNIFEERDILIDNTWSSIDSGYLYIGFIDWGDGSDMDYKDEPFKLGSGKFIEHTYKKSGIYDIRGEMFMIYKCTPAEESSGECAQEGVSRGIISFKEFLLTININRDLELEGEFSNLGGEGYDFIPYGDTSPIIGGVSKYSLYYKILLNINGILNPDKIEELMEIYPPLDEITSVDMPYRFFGDKLNSEIAVVNTDENTLTETKIIPHFTGSFANQSQNISDDQEIIIDIQDNACDYGNELDDNYDGGTGLVGVGFQCILSGSNAFNFNFMTGSYEGDESPFRSAFLDCEDECNIFVSAKDIKGFFDGVVDNSGELLPDDYEDNTITPRLINYGIDIFPGELGDYLGNTDIGQVRYFNKPFQMWQMLGFTGELPESCGCPCTSITEESYCFSPFCIWDTNTGIGQCIDNAENTEVISSDCCTDSDIGYMPCNAFLNEDSCLSPYCVWEDSICDFPFCQPMDIYGCTNQTACNYNPSATILDIDSCVWPDGVCGCSGVIPDGYCDCDGTQPEPFRDCDGNCINDSDNDGVCDEEDECIGEGLEIDECGICDGSGLNDDGCCPGFPLDFCDICGGPGPQVQCWNNVWVCSSSDCLPEPVEGCMNPEACNYNPDADIPDDSCDYGDWYCYDEDGDGAGSWGSAAVMCSDDIDDGYVLNCTDDCESLGFDHLDDMGLDMCGVCNGPNDTGCADEWGAPAPCDILVCSTTNDAIDCKELTSKDVCYEGGDPDNEEGICQSMCNCQGDTADECGVCDGPGPEFVCQNGNLACSYMDCDEFLESECSCTGLCANTTINGIGYGYTDENNNPNANPNGLPGDSSACEGCPDSTTSIIGLSNNYFSPMYYGPGGGFSVMVDYDIDGDGIIDSQVMDCSGMCWVNQILSEDGDPTGQFNVMVNNCHINSRCEIWHNTNEVATWAICNPQPFPYCLPIEHSDCSGMEIEEQACDACGGEWMMSQIPFGDNDLTIDPNVNSDYILINSWPGVKQRVGCVEESCNVGFGTVVIPPYDIIDLGIQASSACCYTLDSVETEEDGFIPGSILCTYYALRDDDWDGCTNNTSCYNLCEDYCTAEEAYGPSPYDWETGESTEGQYLGQGTVSSATCDTSCQVDGPPGSGGVWGSCNCQCIYPPSEENDGDGRRRSQRERREGYSTHPGNPISPRYWKNIIPIDDHIYYRRGVGVLPVLPDASPLDDGGYWVGRPFEVVFGWGNLYREETEIDGNLYDEHIEIMYSLSSGDDIGMIEFEFDGLDIPEIHESSDVNFGGVILSQDEGGFNFVVSSLDGNKLILLPAPSESSVISANSINNVFELIDTNIDGLITMTEWLAQGGNVDEFKDYDHNYGVLYEEDCLEIEGAVWYGNSGSGLYANCGDGYIDVYEAESNSKNKLLIKFPIVNRGTDILFKSIKVYGQSGDIITDFYWNNLSGNLYPYATSKYTGYNGTNIDIYSSQDYLFKNEYGVNYYYPVIPKYRIDGYFDVQNEDGTWENNLGLIGSPYSIPYGTSTRRWDENDKLAPVSSQLISGSYLDHNTIDLDFSTIEDDALNDLSPNTNVGILIDDYDIDYTKNPMELFPEKPTIRTKIGKKDKRKPY